MEPETTEELLSRMEREHVPNIYHPNKCAACDPALWPCERARLVAHARSLEAGLLSMRCYQHMMSKLAMNEPCPDYLETSHCEIARAALGEAQ